MTEAESEGCHVAGCEDAGRGPRAKECVVSRTWKKQEYDFPRAASRRHAGVGTP